MINYPHPFMAKYGRENEASIAAYNFSDLDIRKGTIRTPRKSNEKNAYAYPEFLLACSISHETPVLWLLYGSGSKHLQPLTRTIL